MAIGEHSLALASTLPAPAWADSGVFKAAGSVPPPPKPATFPKVCGCSRVHSEADWKALSYAFRWDIDGELYESRHCECRSTISIRIDLEAP